LFGGVCCAARALGPMAAPAPRARGAPPQGDAQVARHRAGAVRGGGGRGGGGRRAGRRHLPGPAAARAARARAARQGRRPGAPALSQAARHPAPLRGGACGPCRRRPPGHRRARLPCWLRGVSLCGAGALSRRGPERRPGCAPHRLRQGRAPTAAPAAQAGAAAPADADAPAAGPGGRGFKAEREVARRAGAGNRAAWNTLFMRPDTVAAAVAAHYGVTKAELLDRDAAGAGGLRATVRFQGRIGPIAGGTRLPEHVCSGAALPMARAWQAAPPCCAPP